MGQAEHPAKGKARIVSELGQSVLAEYAGHRYAIHFYAEPGTGWGVWRPEPGQALEQSTWRETERALDKALRTHWDA